MVWLWLSLRKVTSAINWRWVGRQKEAGATGQTESEEALNWAEINGRARAGWEWGWGKWKIVSEAEATWSQEGRDGGGKLRKEGPPPGLHIGIPWKHSALCCSGPSQINWIKIFPGRFPWTQVLETLPVGFRCTERLRTSAHTRPPVVYLGLYETSRKCKWRETRHQMSNCLGPKMKQHGILLGWWKWSGDGGIT